VTLNIATFAPVPNAIETTAIAVKPGFAREHACAVAQILRKRLKERSHRLDSNALRSRSHAARRTSTRA
jgi:hypothetical protein